MKKRNVSKKDITIIFSRGVIYLMAFAVFAVCTILLPELAREEAAGKAHPPTTWPFFMGAWVLSIPIYIALYQTHKLVNYIDRNTAFSNRSVKALQIIKVCAIIFSVLVAASAITTVIMVRITAPTEDTPPVLMFGTIVSGTSAVIATFVAVFQRLLRDAINIKKENDLTV